MWPIDSMFASQAVRVYADVVGWPLAIGYQARPRRGCTCQDADCLTLGAHPVPGPPSPRGTEETVRELETSPGAGLVAWTTAFDAVCIFRAVGMAVMVFLDRATPPPCLIDGGHAVLLVQPGTGRAAVRAGLPTSVRSGPAGWVAVPPILGRSWDTPPWVDGAKAPRRLVSVDAIASLLADASAERPQTDA